MRRVSGRPIVVVLVLAGVLFFAGLMAVSQRLQPAADRFHKDGGGTRPTTPRR
jgi:hypothetical protein